MTFAPDPRKSQNAKGIVEKFKAQGYDPEGYTLYTYAAIQVWAAAAEKTKSLDVNKLSAAIRGNKFTTVLGDLQYDKKGDVSNAKYVFYIWDNGEYKEVPNMGS
jgi:branched-chain amino acid transport system substrate-binding protein